MSSKTLSVVFDGEVFRLAEPVDLAPNTSCVIKIMSQASSPPRPVEDAWDILESMTGTLDGPEDWSAEHDHYLYGTPKNRSGQTE